MTIKQVEGYTVYLSQVLGRGSYGNVYRGIKQETHEAVAVKIIPKDLVDCDEYLKSSLKNQIKILQSVISQHIVGFYDVMESTKNYYIIQQLCDGDLSATIKHGEQLPQKYCIDVLTQICTGFLALVREGIIHRDLKPANIMKRGNIFKIGDFGFSKQLMKGMDQNEQLKMKTTVGTPLYMSIQILKSLEYSSKCDIWALGFIFYEMLHGETPWLACRQYQLVNNIENIPLKIKRKDLSPETIDFLKRCLQVYQADRISWNQIFLHPIFQGKFEAAADENKEFQNKMKSIMTKLRFYFNLNRQNLQIFLKKNGYRSNTQDLTFEQYFQFLKAVNPSISHNEAVYIFKKTDIDNSGSISLDQILQMLKMYGIGLGDLGMIKTTSNSALQCGQIYAQTPSHSTNNSISDEKIKQCFVKLYKIIMKNNLSLRKVFNDFDRNKKGYLTFEEFKSMLQKLSKDITDEQANLAFQTIDQDKSKSLQYEQIRKHYARINCLQEGETE